MPIEPEQDPTYLSFQRALGFDDADLRAVTANRKASLLRARQYRIPELANQLTAANQGINDNYLSRGAYSSGHRGMDLGVALNDNTLQAGKETNAYTASLGDLDGELARQLATNQRRLAEEGLAARGRLALENAAVQPAPVAAPTVAPAPPQYRAQAPALRRPAAPRQRSKAEQDRINASWGSFGGR